MPQPLDPWSFANELLGQQGQPLRPSLPATPMDPFSYARTLSPGPPPGIPQAEVTFTPYDDPGLFEGIKRGLGRGANMILRGAVGAGQGVSEVLDQMGVSPSPAYQPTAGYIHPRLPDPRDRTATIQSAKGVADTMDRAEAPGGSLAPSPGAAQPIDLDNWKWWTENLATSAPLLGLQTLVGLAGGGLPGFAITGGGVEAGSVYAEARKRMDAKGVPLEESIPLAAAEAATVGAVSTAVEAIPWGAITGKIPFARQAKREAVKRTVGAAAGAIAKRVAGSAAGEGAEEVLQTMAEDTGKRVFEGDQQAFDDWMRRYAGAGAIGAAAGAGMGGAVATGEKAINAIQFQDQLEMARARKAFNERIRTNLNNLKTRAAEAKAEEERRVIEQEAEDQYQLQRRMAKEWYDNPTSAMDWAVANPEKARTLVEGRRYTNSAMRKADPDLPELAGEEGDAESRRSWFRRVEEYHALPDQTKELIGKAIRGEIKPTDSLEVGEGWSLVSPHGGEVPFNAYMEQVRTPIGTFIRMAPSTQPSVTKPADVDTTITTAPETPTEVVTPEADVTSTSVPDVVPKDAAPPVTELPTDVSGTTEAVPTPATPKGPTDGQEMPAQKGQGERQAEGQAGVQDEVVEPTAAAASSETTAPRNYGTVDKPNRVALGEFFAERLSAGAQYQSILEARVEAGKQLGGKVWAGQKASKEVDESIEQGVVRSARSIVQQQQDQGPRQVFDSLVDLYNRHPILGTRTSTSVDMQAYSTPAPLAYAASAIIGVQPDEKVYDATAGNGMLLIASQNAFGNELDPGRFEAIQAQGIQSTQNDALEYVPAESMDAVILNPPFGRQKDTTTGETKVFRVPAARGDANQNVLVTSERDHAISAKALQAMKDDGRAVVILGTKGMNESGIDKAQAYLNRSQRPYYEWLYDNYNVTDHFTVSGDLYQKMGAKFPVDVIVIEGRGPSQRPKPWNVNAGGTPRMLSTWEEVRNVIPENLRQPGTTGLEAGNRRPEPNDTDRTERGGQDVGRGERPGSPPRLPPGGEPESQPAGNDRRPDTADTGGATTELPDASGTGVRPGVPLGTGERTDTAGGMAETRGGERGPDSTQESGQQPGRPDRESLPGNQRPVLTEADVDNAFDDLFGDILGTATPVETPTETSPSENAPPSGKTESTPKKKSFKKNPPTPQLPTTLPTETPLGFLPQEKQPEQKPPKPPKTPKDKPDTSNKTPREQAKAEMDAALERMKKAFGSTMFSGPPINAEILGALRDFSKAAVKYGVATFKEYVQYLADNIGKEATIHLAQPLRQIWDAMGSRVAGLDASSDVAAILNPEEVRIEDAETEYQKAYTPKSKRKPFNSLAPANLIEPFTKALQSLEERRGDIDEYVRKELGLDQETFDRELSAEQVDAIALAIDSHQQGQALVLADQTGIGKGRVVAAMIHWAGRNGMIPVFFTEKRDLYADMIRDLNALGLNSPPFNILTTAGMEGADKIELPDGRIIRGKADPALLQEAVNSWLKGEGLTARGTQYGAIFSLYSQLRTDEGNETWRHAFFDSIAPHSFIVLDESHNAGGSGDTRKKKANGPRNQAAAFRSLATAAKGVMYSSATFAKRADVLSLYMRTSIARAVRDISQLPQLVRQGGVPLQQVLSAMLAEAGNMIRRERSYKGIKFEPKIVNAELDQAENLSATFLAINRFDVAKEAAIAKIQGDITSGGGVILTDGSIGMPGVEGTNFSSILWNLTDQMLIGLKAGLAAQEAIESLKRGEAPLIAVDSTMEASLKDYVDNFGVTQGQKLDFTYADLMRKYLKRSREIMIQNFEGGVRTVNRRPLTDEELGPEAVRLYEIAEDLINGTDYNVPVSPIDWMRKKITDAGYTVAEVTGRNLTVKYSADGKSATLDRRKQSEKGSGGKIDTIKQFNAGKLDVIILNRSGSTGVSIHSHASFANQRQRHMIIAQAAKNIDEFMQILGRVNRTGQQNLPIYTLLMSDVPAEKRPASVLIKKLSSLNANVTGKSAGAVGFDVPDLMNEVGDYAVARVLESMPSLVYDLDDHNIELTSDGSLEEFEGLARKVTGRMVVMPLATQNEFWKRVDEQFTEHLKQLDEMDANPLSAKTQDLRARTISKAKIFDGIVSSKNPFEQSAFLETVEAKRTGKPYTSDQVRERLAKSLGLQTLTFSPNGYEFSAQVHDKIDSYLQEKLTKVDANLDVQRARLESLPDSSVRIANLEDAAEQLKRKLMTFPIGSPITARMVVIENGARRTLDIPAIAGEVVQPRAASLAPSQWKVELILADPSKRVVVPLSKLNPQGVRSQNTTYWETNGGYNLPDALKEFDAGHTGTTETRVVATGNVVAAFDQVSQWNGRIVFFTREDGRQERGVLMPRRFSYEQWAETQPVRFGNVDHVVTFVERGGIPYSQDGNFYLMKEKNGTYSAFAAKARSTGGMYYLNQRIRDIISPDEFVSAGQWMRVTDLSRTQLRNIVDEVVKFTGLQANTQRDLAKQITGQGRTSAVQAMKVTPEIAQPLAMAPKGYETILSAGDIVAQWEKDFGVPMRAGRTGTALGIYNTDPEVVRQREGDLYELGISSHEVAHHVDKKAGVTSGPLPADVLAELKNLDYEPPKQRETEGWAEFIRHYITRDDASVKAPKTFGWFVGTWLPQHPEWKDAIERAHEYATLYSEQGPLARLNAVVMDRTPRPVSLTVPERVMEYMTPIERKYSDWNDRNYFLSKLSSELTGKGIVRDDDVYLLKNWADGTAPGHATRAVENGIHLVTGTQRIIGKSLQEVFDYLNPGEQEYNEAIWYGLAKQTKEAGEKYLLAIAQGDKAERYNTGMKPEDAKWWIAEVQKDTAKLDRFEKFTKGLTRFANDQLRLLEDSGVITPDERIWMQQAWENYLPLWRVMEDSPMSMGTSKLANQPAAIKRRSRGGSGRAVADPVESLLSRTLYFYSRALTQQVMLELAYQVDPLLGGAEGMGKWMERVDPKNKAFRFTIDKGLKELVAKGVLEKDRARTIRVVSALRRNDPVSDTRMKAAANYLKVRLTGNTAADETIILNEAAAQSIPSEETVLAIWNRDFSPSERDRIVRVIINGQPVLYQVDPDLYGIIAGMPSDLSRQWVESFRQANRMFRMGAVTVSSFFGMFNLLRDPITYQFQAKENESLLPMFSAYKWIGVYAASEAQRVLTGKENEVVRLWKQNAGELMSKINYDRRSIRRTRRSLMRTNPLKFALQHPIASINAGIDTAAKVISWSDVGPRLAEFAAVLNKHGYYMSDGKIVNKQGQPARVPRHVLVQGYNASAEATTNFRRYGVNAKFVDAFLPFFNANLQGKDKRIRTMLRLGNLAAGGSKQQVARRLLLSLVTAGVVSAAYFMARKDDDDYQEQDPAIGDKFWTFSWNGQPVLRIPKPFEWADVFNFVEVGMKAAYQNDPRAVKDYAQRWAWDQIPGGGGILEEGYQQATNYDGFRKRPIESEYLQKLPVSQRYTPYTTELAKSLGQWTGLSPVRIDHALRNTSGGAYSRWYGTIARAADGKLTLRDVPFAGALVIDRDFVKSVDEFYRQKTVLDQEDAVHQRDKTRNPNEVQADLWAKYEVLMSDIRQAGMAEKLGAKEFFEKYERYNVGLARQAIGEPSLDRYPNPLTTPLQDLPPKVRSVVTEFRRSVISAVRGEGRPRGKTPNETVEEYKKRSQDFRDRQEVGRTLLKSFRSQF